MDNQTPSQHLLLQTRTKVVFLVLLFFYLIGVFAYVLFSFRSDDHIPQVKAVSLQMRKEYIDFSSIVRVGLFINNFPEFNFVKNHIVVDSLIWFEYNKAELMLNTIDQFSIEGSKILEKSKPIIRRYGDLVFVKYNVKFEMKTDVDFHRFPLEDHSLSIVLKNDSVTAEEMYFDDNTRALSFKVDDDIFVSDWQIHHLFKSSGYESLLLYPRPPGPLRSSKQSIAPGLL